jgi:hypothetical protein
MSDGYQSLNFKQFEDMMEGCRRGECYVHDNVVNEIESQV